MGQQVGLQLGRGHQHAIGRDRGHRLAAWPGCRAGRPARVRCAPRRSAGMTRSAAPLWVMARRKRPSARGTARSVPTLIAPADSPKIVTLSGSPPKAAMLSRTHSSAAIWSRRPRFASPSARNRKPSGADPVVDGHADDAVAGEAAAVIGRAGPDLEHAARDPDHDRQAGAVGSGVQTLRLRQSSPASAGSQTIPAAGWSAGGRGLRRLRPERQGVADAAPWIDRPRRPEPALAERRSRVRDALEPVHAVHDRAPQASGSGADDRLGLD